MNDYEDMMSVPYVKSSVHPHMSDRDRAAQFSPFDALTGFDEAVAESARETDEQTELSDDALEEIEFKLADLMNANKPIHVDVTYFEPDEKKQGGRYIVYTGMLEKIDAYASRMIFTDGTRIDFSNIKDISY